MIGENLLLDHCFLLYKKTIIFSIMRRIIFCLYLSFVAVSFHSVLHASGSDRTASYETEVARTAIGSFTFIKGTVLR